MGGNMSEQSARQPNIACYDADEYEFVDESELLNPELDENGHNAEGGRRMAEARQQTSDSK
jgi:hypothetical protein